MAKVKGIMPLVGTLGGINFYYRKGELIARAAGGGFNRKSIKTSPNMKRVREQNSEFGNCSQTNKQFKLALKPFLNGYVDGTLHSRLMGLFLKLKTLDALNTRGERTVAVGVSTPFGKKLLKDFVFTPKRPTLLSAQFNFDWTSTTLNITNFGIEWVKFPEQADILEISLQVLRFDFNTLSFTSEYSTPSVLTRDFVGDSISLNAIEPSGTGQLLAVARVCFYQVVNGQNYLLSGDGAYGLSIVSIKP